MEDRDRALLTVIENDLADDSVPTSSILRKCILLGGRSGSIDLSDWARGELNGYGPDEKLPDYRMVSAVIQADVQYGPVIRRGQVIEPADLPDVAREANVGNDVDLRQSLPELEALARDNAGKSCTFARNGATFLAQLMTGKMQESDPFTGVLALHWTVTTSVIDGVVGRVRTALTELVGELVRQLPAEETPTKAAVDNAVSYALTGVRNSTVTIVNSGSATEGSSSSATFEQQPAAAEPKGFWARWRKRGMVVGVVTVLGASATVATWLGWTPWT